MKQFNFLTMRKILFLLLGIMYCSIAFGQFGTGRDFTSLSDTLTDADTVTNLFSTDIRDVYTYAVHVRADSSTGDPAGTVFIQGRQENSDVWVTYQSATLTDAEVAVDTIFQGVPLFKKLRIYVLSTGTQSTPYFIQGRVTRRNW